jgi:hypothetical protein
MILSTLSNLSVAYLVEYLGSLLVGWLVVVVAVVVVVVVVVAAAVVVVVAVKEM